MIRTAVVGFGLSAKTFHLPFIQALPEFELVGLSTHQPEAAAAYPGVAIYPEAEALIADTDAELVIITAPNVAHFPLAEQALTRGLHVVVEKPFVPTVTEGKRLMALAHLKQRVLSVYHNRRWDGDFLTLQQLLREGTLGQLHSLRSHFDRFRPNVQARWREQPGPGAGAWYDLGSHLLDQALCLLGIPEALTAQCVKLRPGAQVTDYFDVQLHYPDLEVVLHGSPFAAGPVLRFEAQGHAGSYHKYGLDPQEERLKAGTIPQGDWGKEKPEAYGYIYPANTAYPTLPGNYTLYFQQLAAALRQQGPIPVPASEALQVIHLLDLAERSSAMGQTLQVTPWA